MTQDTLAIALVLAAAAHLAWRGWQVLRSRPGSTTGCGACSACPAEDRAADESPAVVQISYHKKGNPIGRGVQSAGDG